MTDEPTGQHPLDRLAEEFVACFRRGERPAMSEYVRRYPELADQIPDVLQTLALMEECGPGQPDAPGGGSTTNVPPRQLGDYHILREVGRGGMGIVYEADQISLGRRVALKVLPFAATLDARQLQRFKNEVQAAAHLHHQHIVPVYAVGCERGVHYYAMQFIDGQTLAATVGELRQLAGIDPDGDARSLGPEPSGEPSHEPAPAAPTANTPWLGAAAAVTKRSDKDPAFFRTAARFGVEAAEALEHAHQLGVVHRDIKPANLLVDSRGHLWVTDFGLAQVLGDPRLTMTGDLVGTLRYMSPEQALAKPIGLDHRTDVYSLGATLYELLTLRPAFPGRDRQELLRQIAFEEPPPPRRVNRSIPADLETIILRAMAKQPEERFGSAQELADDLRRFLDDRPVQARRPTLANRLKKWARRHRAAVLTAGVALVVFLSAAVVALAVSNALIRLERDRANANATATGVARAEALENQRQAFAAADRLLTRVAEWQLRDVPQMEEARRTLLEDALEFYRGYFRKQGNDPDVRQETGKAFTRTAVIYQLLGQSAKAEEACRQALAIQESLAAEFANEPQYRHDLAHSFNELGKLLRDGDRVTEAESAFRRGLDVQQSLAREHPSAAVRVLQSAILNNLGYQQRQQGHDDQSLKSFVQARDLLEQLLREDAGNRQYTEYLANAYNMLGLVSRTLGRSGEAQDFYRKALELVWPLADDRPDNVDLQELLAKVYNNLGLAYIGTREYSKAEETLRQSLPIHERLFRQHPKVVHYAVDVGGTYGNLGKAVGGSGNNAGALEWYERAMPILEQALAMEPHHTTSRSSLFATLFDRAQHLGRLGRPADAAKDWARLVEISEGQSHITMRVYRVPVLARLGEHARATAEAEALVAEGQTDGATLYHFAYTHALSAAAASRDERLAPDERERLAERYGARAVELLAQARAAGHFQNPARLAHLQTDQDINAIRPRPDFQRLLADLNATMGGPGSPPMR